MHLNKKILKVKHSSNANIQVFRLTRSPLFTLKTKKETSPCHHNIQHYIFPDFNENFSTCLQFESLDWNTTTK